MHESNQQMAQQREQVLSTARMMLNGDLGIIQGARILTTLRHHVTDEDHDADFMPFIGIESETDHLPLGTVRQHWSEAALLTKDARIQEAEDFFRDAALSACIRLVERFERGV